MQDYILPVKNVSLFNAVCGDYGNMGLSGDVTASSFCKAASSKTENIEDFAPEDRAKSLLHMISNDIGQLAYLYAKINDCKKVWFENVRFYWQLDCSEGVLYKLKK